MTALPALPRRLLQASAANAAAVTVAALLVFCLFAVPDFYNSFNLKTVIEQSAVLGIVTTGQTLVLMVRGFDLSVGAVAGVMAMAVVMVADTSPVLAVLIGLGTGVLVGVLNSWFVVIRGVPPFVATLGMLITIEGARFTITNGQASGTVPGFVSTLGRGTLAGIPIAGLIWVGLTLVVAFALCRTSYGRRLYATGTNPEAARMAGVHTGLITASAYVICAVFAALAGLLLTGYVGYVDQSTGVGQNLNLNSIAAAVIGGVALSGGEGNVIGPMAGAFLLTMLANIILVLGLPIELQWIVQGGVLIAAITLMGLRRG